MKLTLSFIVLLTTVLYTSAQIDLRLKQFNLDHQLALEGYDPVAYFLQHKAVEGKKEINATIDGVRYYFSSASTKEIFIKDPKKYEPQYGGWCAYAMGSTGETVEVDPETFKIINGKLYLFYNRYLNNTLTKWNKDERNLQTKADLNWSRLFK